MSENDFEPLQKLNRDLKQSARLMGQLEARYLVDLYYQVQTYRISQAHQFRQASEQGEPGRLLAWGKESMATFERNIQNALGEFARTYRVGQWLQSICGIGPVISAGLLANLRVPPPMTAGHYLSFAGLVSTSKWIGAEKAKELVASIVPRGKPTTDQLIKLSEEMGWHSMALLGKVQESADDSRENVIKILARRPWSAMVKTLTAFKLGECFVKVKSNSKDFYGAIYESRKRYEMEKNDRRDYADQAAAGAKRVGRSTEAYKFYMDGRLPPGHIHARCRRYAVKMFISHLHEVMYRDYFEKAPPVPYVFAKSGGDHRHYIAPPNWPGDFDGKSLRDLAVATKKAPAPVQEVPETSEATPEPTSEDVQS